MLLEGKKPNINSIPKFVFMAGNEIFEIRFSLALISKAVAVNALEAAPTSILIGTEVSILGNVKLNSCSFLTSNDSPNH